MLQKTADWAWVADWERDLPEQEAGDDRGERDAGDDDDDDDDDDDEPDAAPHRGDALQPARQHLEVLHSNFQNAGKDWKKTGRS